MPETDLDRVPELSSIGYKIPSHLLINNKTLSLPLIYQSKSSKNVLV